MPLGSEAVADSVIVWETVEPAVGAVMLTVGPVVPGFHTLPPKVVMYSWLPTSVILSGDRNGMAVYSVHVEPPLVDCHIPLPCVVTYSVPLITKGANATCESATPTAFCNPISVHVFADRLYL